MILTLTIICTIILILVTAEVQVWGFTLNRHAYWIKEHPGLDKRVIHYQSLFYTSIFTSVLAAFALITWVWMVVMGGITTPLLFISFLIYMGGYMSIISYLFLIAKVCRLCRYFYPPLTVYICKWYKGKTS